MARRFVGVAIVAGACAFALLSAPALHPRQRAISAPTTFGHWQLLMAVQAGPALVVRGAPYRLVSKGRQLTIDSELERAAVSDPAASAADIWLQTGNGRPVDGTLNESRALYIPSAGG